MKNWIYVSMTLLTGLAAGNAQAISQTPLSAEEISQCLKQLDLDKAPGLRDGSPCMSTTR